MIKDTTKLRTLRKGKISEEETSVNRRVKDFMKYMGFSYGRLKRGKRNEKWERSVRIVAPGPGVIAEKDELPKVSIVSKEKIIKNQGFTDCFNLSLSKSRSVENKRTQNMLTPGQSPSQQEAKKYLQYLDIATPEEKKVIKSKVGSIISEFKSQLLSEVPRKVKDLNERGILANEINEMRASSMLNVKLKKQKKFKLEPLIRKVKAELATNKLKAFIENSERNLEFQELQTNKKFDRANAIKSINNLIEKNRKTDNLQAKQNITMYSSDTDWAEGISKSIEKIKVRSSPNDLSLVF